MAKHRAHEKPRPSLDPPEIVTRGYQQEMLEESLRRNIIIALDTGAGKTHIAVLRMKHEMEREPTKLSWFIAPTVALCGQQMEVIKAHLPVPVGIVSGANEPDQWKNGAELWGRVLKDYRIMISTPQVLLDAMRHGFVILGRDISLLIFDEAHHAVDNHPYNRIMQEFYFDLPPRSSAIHSSVVRPMVLGLTASPIYGGNVENAFRTIEGNLDSTIRAPRRTRAELAQCVHRPTFKHVMYYKYGSDGIQEPFSTNLAALSNAVSSLNIEDDPFIKNLRKQLAKSTPGSPDYIKTDQKLSKFIQKKGTFTHKGLTDFLRTGSDILMDLGAWAADWYVYKVIERAKEASNPYNNMMVSWKKNEKSYLLEILNKVVVSPVSYSADDIVDDCSNKVEALIECLLMEKAMTESLNETYSSIVFVQRRDCVLALAELLKHHPSTKDLFQIGQLIGTSEDSRRHAMMDITRYMVKEEPQVETLGEFKSGDKNLIISTAVAEEGIDIQACGSVIRWDLPPNMASWAQSRGRARKQRSTFTLMFSYGGAQQSDVAKWEELERQMVALYNDPSRDIRDDDEFAPDAEDDDQQFTVAETGAKVTLHSAISHLNHFCSVIPNSTHADNRPLFERDPPEFPVGWHSFLPGYRALEPYLGPYGATVTLPRALPLPRDERITVANTEYATVISAYRHAAYRAYVKLYSAGLLDQHLLPIGSVLEPQLEDEVKAMLADVEKREGLASIMGGIDPWARNGSEDSDEDESWATSILTIEGLPPLMLFTQCDMIPMAMGEGPILYRPGQPPTRVSVTPVSRTAATDDLIHQAKEYTRAVFWALNGSRMNWDDLNFSYFFLPKDSSASDEVWRGRRGWWEEQALKKPDAFPYRMISRADKLKEAFSNPQDLTLIQKHYGQGKPYKFIGWRHDPLSEEELEKLEAFYHGLPGGLEASDITYPLLAVQDFPPRTNFLIPIKPRPQADDEERLEPPTHYLLPQHSGVILVSPTEAAFAFLLPSVFRHLYMSLTADSLVKTLFLGTNKPSPPLASIPLPLLVNAITAPSSQERLNYQRLETLGDTVLKFCTGINLMAEYPLWHEGYLTKKKDHAVSNVRLAKEDLNRGLYKWIIRDIMLGKKWKPRYFTTTSPSTTRAGSEAPISPVEGPKVATPPAETVTPDASANSTTSTSNLKDGEKPKKKKAKKSQQLSTKVLADVVESTIGAAYLHGGIDLGYECIKFFDLGLKWEPIPDRITQILTHTDKLTEDESGALVTFPPQLVNVERMLGYTFKRKLLLIEALTHASYQDDCLTPSYERMEFLGDSVLDMIVTDFLYHAPGKNYSPGHIHLRKSAVVNAHILAYICLKTSVTVSASIPKPNQSGQIEEVANDQEIPLYRCLLHSSSKVLEDQLNTATRFRRMRPEIDEALTNGSFFPWAALTRLQAPKLFSDMIESLIGAVFLDSYGSFETVKEMITRLGIMPILETIVASNVDVLHPVSRLSLWAQKHEKKVEYVNTKEHGRVSCKVLVDGVEGATVSDEWRGKPSQDEVRFAAAETAIKAFKLRDVGTSYGLKKKKNKPKNQKNKSRKKTV